MSTVGRLRNGDRGSRAGHEANAAHLPTSTGFTPTHQHSTRRRSIHIITFHRAWTMENGSVATTISVTTCGFTSARCGMVAHAVPSAMQQRTLGFAAGVVVLMLAWDPPLIGPLAGLNFDWSNWNTSDMRPMLGLNEWPCDPDSKLLQARKLTLQDAEGPESLAFSSTGAGPYTGVSDGRILRWDGNESRWLTFGVTSSIRTEVCDVHPPLVRNERICGRPLGLRFDKHDNLYIADAYFGLLVMGPEGGVAKPVSTQAEGVPFRFVNDLDLDENGTVYFTDSSSRRPRSQCNIVTFEQDRSGRVLRYDPKTQQTTVLARDLFYPNGVAVSLDSSFMLLSHTSKTRIGKYWLKGPKIGTLEEFAEVPGFPDNIRRTREGDFWVALHSRVTKLQNFLANHWYLLRILYSLPLRFEFISRLTTGTPDAMVIKFNPNGEAIEAFEDRMGQNTRFLSFADERDGVLWMSSVIMPSIWTLPLNASAASHS